MNSYMETWEKLATPPEKALKEIEKGRLAGKFDINPQWRIKKITEIFGQCGVGWKYEIVKLWKEETAHDQVFVFAQINLFTKTNDKWSEPIPGTGGSKLVTLESKGLYSNDEAYKMAITDALSVCMKMIGVASDVYEGKFDDSKYTLKDKAEKLNPKTSTSQHKKKANDDGKEWLNTLTENIKVHIYNKFCENLSAEEILTAMRTRWKISKKMAAEILTYIESFDNEQN